MTNTQFYRSQYIIEISVKKIWFCLVTMCSYVITCWWLLSRYPNSLITTKQVRNKSFRKLNQSSIGAFNGLGLYFFILLLIHTQANEEVKNPVCVADIDIKNNLTEFLSWKHCKVLEGSLMISAFSKDFLKHDESQMDDVSLPELTEITGFLLLYKADHIIDLAKILPKLAVIRGNKLTNNYALIIYRMKFMERISLPSLTHIVKGGIKIEKNPNLCYVDTVDWKKIVDKHWHDDISIEENSEEERCPKTCPLNCPTKCWNPNTCQKLVVPCSDLFVRGTQDMVRGGTDSPGGEAAQCYSQGGSVISGPCDKQCLGGCSGTTQADCISCRNMWFPNHNDISLSFGCYERCPKRLLSYMNWTCITNDECMSLSNCSGSMNKVVPYKILRSSTGDQCVKECPGNYQSKQVNGINECVKCKDCPKICISYGDDIKSYENIKSFSGCTIIDGDLQIQVSKSNLMTALEENLGKIKVIRGSLRITSSKSLESLQFFKSLERIEGRGPDDPYGNQSYAIEILENNNLQKLFEENKNISINGKALIHYNPQLCRKEITRLVNKSGIHTGYDKEHLDISDSTNGNKAVCTELELKVRTRAMSGNILLIEFENFEKNLAKKNLLLGYNIHFREITEKQFAYKNLTKYNGREACGEEIWETINQRKLDSTISKERINREDLIKCKDKCHSKSKVKNCRDKCIKKATESMEYPETSFISPLNPYTPYAIYVSTMMTTPFYGSEATGAQSKIIYVRTLTGIPDPVRKLNVIATSTSLGLEISWEPPLKPNGILDHYDIIVEFNTLQDALINRDWCNVKKNKPTKNQIILKTNNKANKTSVCPQMDCRECKNGDINPKPVEVQDHISDKNLEYDIINMVFDQQQPQSDCNKSRSANQDDVSIVNTIEEGTGELSSEEKVRMEDGIIQVNSGKETIRLLANNMTEETGDTFYFTRMYIQVSGNETSLKLTIDHLKNYGQYLIKVRACHRMYVGNGHHKNCKIGQKCKDCSFDEEVVRKTMAKPKADDIVNPYSESSNEAQLLIAKTTKVTNDKAESKDNGTNLEEETYIRWLPPMAPNAIITMYKLRMKKDLADESDEHVNCISFNDPRITPWEERPGWVQYKLTWAGNYYISLKAVSLYGEGAWTSYQWAQVETDNNHVIYIVLVVILVSLFVLFGLCIGLMYKKRRSQKESPMIVSVNPEYILLDDIYIVDGWEVRREVIETQEELGKGSFGMVYRGLYHHPHKGDLNVAIKTVNNEATLKQRIEFLNEASVMKDLDTEHVVKLIGVVSQGQPTLVLMELMEVGDLKNYLRTLRPNSDANVQREKEGKEKIPPPTVKQIEKMALDIADGMAYLSVKKCIHRDLAARNCMVNSDITVKIGDFGMARDVYETEYYRKEGKGMLPVRWMAPESLRDGVFTSQSDVWSYGVVLWEMATLAEQPYQGLANDQVIFYVKEGNVMEKPENCPEKLHGIMSDCWKRSASQRPTFLEICDRLLEGQDNASAQSFSSSSFYHSSQGREAVANETNVKAAQQEADESASNNIPGEENPLIPVSHMWKAEQFVQKNIENEKGERSRSPGTNSSN